MIRTVASLAGITAAFLLVLYLTYNDDGGDSISSTPAPSRAAAASPSQTGQPQDSAADAVLTRGEPVEFPEDVALIVGQTCQRCDEGEYSAILRVNRDEEDGIWVDQLFPPLGLGDHKVTSVAVSFGKMIAVTSCPANCVQMPSGEQTLYVSTDGGVTWVEWERVGGDAFVAMVRHVSASEGIEFDQVVVGYPPTTSGGDYAFTAYPPSLAPYHTSIPSEAFQGVVPGVGPVWLRPHDEFIPMNQLMTLDDWSYRSFDDSVNWRLLSVAYFRTKT